MRGTRYHTHMHLTSGCVLGDARAEDSVEKPKLARAVQGCRVAVHTTTRACDSKETIRAALHQAASVSYDAPDANPLP